MASLMKRPLAEQELEATPVPVPLHHWRMWGRGFNQSLLIARGLDRPLDPDLLRRTRATPKLKGLNPSQRRKTVEGVFAVRAGADVKGRSFILVDDVMTTGATAEACARALHRAGARKVELWHSPACSADGAGGWQPAFGILSRARTEPGDQTPWRMLRCI